MTIMAVRMSERAAREFKALCNSRDLQIDMIRLRVDAEHVGEKKLSVSLRLDDQVPCENDVVQETGGAQLVINEDLDRTLGEARVDFKKEGGGFVLEPVQ